MKIYKNTVSDILWEVLVQLMEIKELDRFRLVGGTSLSLLLGHRMSVDIDMFSDSEYGAIDFPAIYKLLKKELPYISKEKWLNKTMGNSCFVGRDPEQLVKLDMFYTDPFVYPIIEHEGVRISSLEEIAAMKLEVISRGGRKKDFWDIHALSELYTVQELLGFYKKRYPFSASKEKVVSQLTVFKKADHDPDPNCLKGKHWELVKIDIEEWVGG